MKFRDQRAIELEEKILRFKNRKNQQYPELRLMESTRESTSLLTRVQDFVAIWPHVGHPRHSH